MSSPIAPAFEMGELWLPYTQYRDTVDGRGLHQTHFIAVDPSIAEEQFKKSLLELTIADAASTDLAKLASDAQKMQVNTRHMDLLKGGFAGTITSLFDRIMAASYAVNHVGLPLEAVVDAEEQDRIAAEIAIYSAIPSERRKGAKVVDEGRAYYWGGRYTLIPVAEVIPIDEDTNAEPRDIHQVVAAAKAGVVIDGEGLGDDDGADVNEDSPIFEGLRLVQGERQDLDE